MNEPIKGVTAMHLRQETLGQLKRQVDQLVERCGKDAPIIFYDDETPMGETPIGKLRIECCYED